MSAASPYFRNLFESEQGLSPVIEINDIDSDTFERLVAFCYKGIALITKDNAEKMLKAAMTLKLNDVVLLCADFLVDHISIFTITRLYSLEYETKCIPLSKKIQEFEKNNFNKVKM